MEQLDFLSSGCSVKFVVNTERACANNRLDKLLQIISKFSSRPIHDEALEEPGLIQTAAWGQVLNSNEQAIP